MAGFDTRVSTGVMLRRPAVCILLALALALLLPATALAAPANDPAPRLVYFPQTGHYLAYGFLDYWLEHGQVAIFGYPISEELTDPATGLTVQYFERAVFEYHPDNPPAWRVELRRLGALATANRQSEPPFQPLNAQSDDNCTYFPQTGHRLCFGFRAYWQQNGGLAIFGYPLSEEFQENGYTVQYFERARFEYHPSNPPAWRIELGLLGSNAAAGAHVATSPLAQSPSVETYDPGLWYVPAPPEKPTAAATPPAGAPSNQAKWIEVDLSDQYLRAWTYSTPVYYTRVSTGVPGHQTPTGTFAVYAKYAEDDMTGGTPGVDYYNLPDVPDVMYFYQAYAIHGAYWHNNFGSVMSHGCVNLPLDAADWMFNWTPVGTTVWIHS
ncbi:MAG TPA: L,D-transpeptidase [Nitrolancea sp.]|nr:L,D-transpeptidase [Nitrolancea sp.]